MSEYSLLMQVKKGKLQRELAKLFNCGKIQIENMLTNHNHYIREWEDNCKENKVGIIWRN